MNIPKFLFRLALGRRLPMTNGRIVTRGVRHAARIRRDRYGVPYIDAQSDEDAWYALGFCQGQDRSFRLETLLRAARGTLSELVGPGALPADRLSRRIGFTRLAPGQLDALSPDVQARFDAFAIGINDGSSLGCDRKAHEFTLLRGEPSRFTAVDLVAVYLLQAMALSANWDIELVRLRILQEDGPEALALLDPRYPERHPVNVPQGADAGTVSDALSKDMAMLIDVVGASRASNSWAVSPSRTAAGRPILANDPHLVPSLPPHWYLAHVRTPRWGLVGATFSGLPAFPIGHNGSVAWGVTLGLADNSDLFLERLGPDGVSVRDGDGFVRCQVIEEKIEVRGRAPELERVLITPRGPVVARSSVDDSLAVSLDATWLHALPVEGLLQAHRPRACEEFRGLFAAWPHTSINVTYADVHGDIGFQLAGQVPRRRTGYGALPLPGWRADVGWLGSFVKFDEMPHVNNPPRGCVVTANNQPSPYGQGPFLGVDWLDGYRAARIAEIVEAREDWDIDSTRNAQLDTVSLPWREMREAVLSVEPRSDASRRARDILAEWDGAVDVGSVGAAVFEFFLVEMTRRVARRNAPKSWEWVLGRSETPIHALTLLAGRRVGHLLELLRNPPDGWSRMDLTDCIEESLDAAVGQLRGRYGGDQERWRWGSVRRLAIRHPFGRNRALGAVFNLPSIPFGGDTNTVLQAGVDPRDPAGNPLVCPSIRMTLDVGNWDENSFAMPGGQSGNPLSPHYADQFRLWERGAGITIPWSPEAVERVTVATLSLDPESDGGR